MNPLSKTRLQHISLFTVTALGLLLSACGGGGKSAGNDSFTANTPSYTVTATVDGSGGSISPANATVDSGNTTSFTITPDTGYNIDNVTGCGGSMSGNTYTTSSITADCTVSATFTVNPTNTTSYTVTATVDGSGGSISPANATVDSGNTTSFTITPDADYNIDSVTGCGGSVNGNTYTTGSITADCTVSATFAVNPTISIANAEVVEGNSGITSLNFVVSLSAQANGDVTVDYASSDDTATSDSDYVATNGTLTISNTTTSNTISISVNGDTTLESSETLTLTLSNASSNAILGTATATGTILNDDNTGSLNDTGVTLCGDFAYDGSGTHNNDVDCAVAGATQTVDGTETANGFDPVPAGQDALFGRDSTVNDDSDGHAGFSFTKIDSNGNVLAADASSWDCVLDNVTGLIWEIKTNDNGLRDKNWTYTWFNSNSTTNGGKPGTTNGGSCYDSSNCDTEKYVTQVNAEGLCGYTDWRMPNLGELQSIADLGSGSPTIDSNYFPNTNSEVYWSESVVVSSTGFAWGVDFSYVEGNLGATKNSDHYVRLVHDQP
jgi:hypothetical protein